MSRLEEQLQQIPKPALAALLIFGVIIFLFISNPPHTICDAQKENIQTGMAGVLFPIKVAKRTTPGRIHSAMEVCMFGNSGGACYEYFEILRRTAKVIKETSSECTAKMLKIPIAKYAKVEEYQQIRDGQKVREELASVNFKQVPLEQVLLDGLEVMVQKAWGEAPPERGSAQRFGWFRESELNVFCHVRDVLERAKGREGMKTVARSIYTKLPGEVVAREVAGQFQRSPLPKRATQVFREQEIYERSLMSAPCGHFR